MRALRAFTPNASVARDVSATIATKVRDVAEHEERELTTGTTTFIEDRLGRVIQPTLRFGDHAHGWTPPTRELTAPGRNAASPRRNDRRSEPFYTDCLRYRAHSL